MTSVYLDNNATTRVDIRVAEAMLPTLTEVFGNPSSLHAFGAVAKAAVAAAREDVRALIGAAHADEIVFTSGGTESDALAILGALGSATSGRTEIVISVVEHPAVRRLCQSLQKTRGLVLHEIPVDGHGRLDRAAYAAALSARTALVSIMWANNETGTVFPVADLAAAAKTAGALFHTDAVQAVGRLPVGVAERMIDLLSLSGHKLHAPKGVGALYVRRGVRLAAQTSGGSQERGRRAGTENVPGIVALGAACALAAERIASDTPRIAALRDTLETGLLARVAGARVLGDSESRVANTTSIAFAAVESEAVVRLLDRHGIAVSSGSACAAGSVEPSHVVRAMGVPEDFARGVVRFSLSRETTAAEIDRVLAVVPAVIGELRADRFEPAA
ncbi:aminotransferase class V-fold PLP-dependent enzyme [Rhodoplanes sp. TEM]|uniref:Cysteine desulfurase n=1 Tax=Rhodoplanes tepidamans TaxID=200616 RepID=A0ABT5JFZ2_RHOTP|nr:MULTISPECIES: aminotransferase class V-fold PLP-dependent enzyme [Rhodoplanes]MDC7788408.1 aminotransferase class V-fold PLP-dependent enzyme [Rhodoplanes tepidamans]MDC7985907.1 aminotransferase class V-fold PLP-dependent enzyme [Rhodoplanes sp. TEM]MDQ0357093.1 cysteine desulfurase [Rhodoplanes tepidamans]